jgi:hypothetical protein
MSKAETYRSYAGQCLAVAQKMTDPRNQRALIQIAIGWHKLATKEERPETERGHSIESVQQAQRLVSH